MKNDSKDQNSSSPGRKKSFKPLELILMIPLLFSIFIYGSAIMTDYAEDLQFFFLSKTLHTVTVVDHQMAGRNVFFPVVQLDEKRVRVKGARDVKVGSALEIECTSNLICRSSGQQMNVLWSIVELPLFFSLVVFLPLWVRKQRLKSKKTLE